MLAVWVLQSALVLCLCVLVACSSIAGIDLGNQYVKVSIITPGKPIQMVLNAQSKRKTPAALSFLENTRCFGDEAISHSVRGSSSVIRFFNDALAKTSSSPRIFSEDFYPYEFVEDTDRGSFRIRVKDGVDLTVEEVFANVLQFVKSMAMRSINEAYGTAENTSSVFSDVDAVITVPVSVRMRQRRALLDAARISNVNVLSLVMQPAAAALYHILDIPANTNTTKIFYDMGARYIQACVVTYRMLESPNKPDVKVLGCGQNSSPQGGHAADILLAQYMATKFEQEHGPVPPAQRIRFFSKMLREASIKKHVLSANKSCNFNIESLLGDVDFRKSITRDEFNRLLEEAGMLENLAEATEKALEVAKLTLDDVSMMELVGGGWRIPRVYSALEETFPKVELAQHCNADEAVAMGAGLVGASYSSSVRAKPLRFSEASSYCYSVKIVRDNEEVPTKRRILVEKGGPLNGVAKTVSLKAESVHLTVMVLEDDDVVDVYKLNLEKGLKKFEESRGVEAASRTQFQERYAEENKETKIPETPGHAKITIHFSTGPTGILVCDKATLIWEETTFKEVEKKRKKKQKENVTVGPAETGKIKKEAVEGETNLSTDVARDTSATSGPTDAEPGVVAETGDRESNETESAVGDSTVPAENEAVSSTSAPSLYETAKRIVMTTKPRIQNVKLVYAPEKPLPYTSDQITASRKVLSDFVESDAREAMLQEAQNSLESYVYFARNAATSDEDVMSVAYADVLNKIVSLAHEAEEWLLDTTSSDADQYVNRKKALQDLVEPLIFRSREKSERSRLVKEIEKSIQRVNEEVSQLKQEKTWIPAERFESVEQSLVNFQDWFAKASGEQEKLDVTADPIFICDDVRKIFKQNVTSIVNTLKRMPKQKAMNKKEQKGGEEENSVIERGNQDPVVEPGKQDPVVTPPEKNPKPEEGQPEEKEDDKDEL